MDSLIQYLDIINKYSSLILVLATVVYVGFTIVLAKETRKLREVETSPFVSIIFDTSFQAVSHSKIIIKNIGKAPGYDITFDVDEKYIPHFNGYTFENKISYFAPDQEFYILADGFNNLKEAGFESIPITVHYKSKDDRSFTELFNLGWQHFQYYETDNIEVVKKSLEEINKEIKNINTTLKDKKYIISTKLSILEIEKKDDYIQFIFSNGQIFKIQREEIANIGLNDIEKVYLNNGDLTDHSINKRFTAEEIFYNISNLKENEELK